MSSFAALHLVTGHLNVPVGPVLSAAQLATALRAGSVAPLRDDPRAAALVSSLFVDASPDLILRAALEAAAPVSAVQRLYQETQADHLPRVPEWEEAVECLL